MLVSQTSQKPLSQCSHPRQTGFVMLGSHSVGFWRVYSMSVQIVLILISVGGFNFYVLQAIYVWFVLINKKKIPLEQKALVGCFYDFRLSITLWSSSQCSQRHFFGSSTFDSSSPQWQTDSSEPWSEWQSSHVLQQMGRDTFLAG